MDPTPHLRVEPAPTTVFRHLEARGDRVRFRVPRPDGSERLVRWHEMAAQVRAIAATLRAHGVGPGDKGAVFAGNSVEWFFAALAIEAVGAAMVPVYPTTTADGLAYMLEHGDVAVVFVDGPDQRVRLAEVAAGLPKLRLCVTLAGDAEPLGALPSLTWPAAIAHGEAVDAAEPGRFEADLAAIDLDTPAVMLYTSGTTGRPKGVPLTHRNVGVNGCDWLRCYGSLVEEGDVDLLWLPLSHIFGFGEACLGNTLGFESTLTTPALVLDRLTDVRPHVFMSVPAYWEKLATLAAAEADPGAALRRLTGGRLRFCLSGGAGLNLAVKEFFAAHGIVIMEGYGLTEASPTLTLNRPERYRFDSVGLPLPSVELRLADDGEILARGPSIFAGYHKDPDATASTLDAEGWLHTGDLGRFTEDGFLQIIGRKKEILVTAGGKNVPPANIESRFADDSLIAHVVVYGDGKRYLVAGIWLDPAAAAAATAGMDAAAARARLEAEVAARIERVNQDLDRYMTLKRFRIFPGALTVEDGTLTATLKLRRKAIDAVYGAQLEELYA
ncbi:MAG: hypothetical protein RIT45_1197 [Pseudomonadota bacterium]